MIVNDYFQVKTAHKAASKNKPSKHKTTKPNLSQLNPSTPLSTSHYSINQSISKKVDSVRVTKNIRRIF